MAAAAGLTPLVLSLRSAGLAVLLVLPAGRSGAAERVRHWQGPRRTAADLLLLSPLVLPPTVLGFVLLQLLGRYGPLGASRWQRLGLELVFSWPATVLSAAVVAFPLMYRTVLASLEQLDPALEEVARSLGAGPGRVLRRITLPLVLPGLGAGLSLSYARALGEFGTTLMLAGNIPGRTQTLPLAIYAAVDAGDLPQAWRLDRPGAAAQRALSGAGAAGPEPAPPAAAPWAQRAGAPGPCRPRRSSGARRSLRPPGPFALAFELQQRHGDFQLDLALATDCRRLAILGASGAGKSLLLRTLAGLERPRAGRIELNGRVLLDGGARHRPAAGAAPHRRDAPARRPVPPPHRGGQRGLRPGPPGAGRARAPGWRSSWRRWGCWSWPGTIPPSSRGASSSARPWPGPWWSSPTCCCWTNPSPPRTPTGAGGCSS